MASLLIQLGHKNIGLKVCWKETINKRANGRKTKLINDPERSSLFTQGEIIMFQTAATGHISRTQRYIDKIHFIVPDFEVDKIISTTMHHYCQVPIEL